MTVGIDGADGCAIESELVMRRGSHRSRLADHGRRSECHSLSEHDVGRSLMNREPLNGKNDQERGHIYFVGGERALSASLVGEMRFDRVTNGVLHRFSQQKSRSKAAG
jgi:hypothetical protein